MSIERSDLDIRLIEYLYGELDEQAAQALKAEIDGSPELLEQLVAWRSIQALVDQLPEEIPDPEISRSILEAAQADIESAKIGFWEWLQQLSMAPALAAVFLLVAGGGLLLELTGQFEDTPRKAMEPAAKSDQVKEMPSGPAITPPKIKEQSVALPEKPESKTIANPVHAKKVSPKHTKSAVKEPPKAKTVLSVIDDDVAETLGTPDSDRSLKVGSNIGRGQTELGVRGSMGSKRTTKRKLGKIHSRKKKIRAKLAKAKPSRRAKRSRRTRKLERPATRKGVNELEDQTVDDLLSDLSGTKETVAEGDAFGQGAVGLDGAMSGGGGSNARTERKVRAARSRATPPPPAPTPARAAPAQLERMGSIQEQNVTHLNQDSTNISASENARLILQAAVLSEVAGRWLEAIEHYKKYLALKPDTAATQRAQIKIGQCYEQLGDQLNATLYYRRALRGGGPIGNRARAALRRLGNRVSKPTPAAVEQTQPSKTEE